MIGKLCCSFETVINGGFTKRRGRLISDARLANRRAGSRGCGRSPIDIFIITLKVTIKDLLDLGVVYEECRECLENVTK